MLFLKFLSFFEAGDTCVFKFDSSSDEDTTRPGIEGMDDQEHFPSYTPRMHQGN